MLGKNVLVGQFEVAVGASKGLTQKDEEELIWPGSTVGGADTGERGRPSRGQMTLHVAPTPSLQRSLWTHELLAGHTEKHRQHMQA